MLNPDASKRITIPKALEHQWFKKFTLKTEVQNKQLQDLYNNIISLKTDPKLFFQHATFAYIVHHLAKKEDIQDIRKFFLHFDTMGLGTLTHDQILGGLKEISKRYKNGEEKLREILNFLDQGKTGMIEYEGNITYYKYNLINIIILEFIRSFIDKKKLLTEEYINTTFMLFTKSENKKMSPLEFKTILGINVNFSEKMWETIIKEIDKNGDGQVRIKL